MKLYRSHSTTGQTFNFSLGKLSIAWYSSKKTPAQQYNYDAMIWRDKEAKMILEIKKEMSVQ